ncbi:DUF2877 domain-containing protein [Amphibacillus sediminis]|uniref:DUF2877 domain-containing protein n=1 Tax=Amphibacillus sediminis TaxID=360185 RepID=UPI000837664A|nr:DUF2877 domain-containing protein [Amphibacillus sediminis]
MEIKRYFQVEYGVVSNYLPHILSSELKGKIHSVFNTSFNIEFNHSLIHLGALGTPLSAFGINIPAQILNKLLGDIQVGGTTEWMNGKLMIHTPHLIYQLKLDKIAQIDLSIKPIQIQKESLVHNALFQKIEQLDFLNKSDVIYSDQDLTIINQLINAAPTNRHLIKDSIHYFFGRGIGLTPSGDDFISGLLMAEAALTPDSYWKDELNEHLSKHSTTDVSRHYLNCLIAGYVSEHFKQLLINLNQAVESTKAERLVKDVTNYGHTSGYDTLFGLYVALKQKYWRK